MAALELASGACMAASGISILPNGRERAQQLAAGRGPATVKRWRAWLALLSALGLVPCAVFGTAGGCPAPCIAAFCKNNPCVRLAGLQSFVMLSAGWEHAASVAICMAAFGATGLCVAGCASGCVAVSERERCSAAAQTHVFFQGAVIMILPCNLHGRRAVSITEESARKNF